jgi:hypothetical protein
MPGQPAAIELDASTVECLVFTKKEGMLSKVAHDLKIRVTDLALAWDGATLTGRFDPGSLRVVAAMVRGRESAGMLSEGDKKKIEKSIVSDVLHARKHPRIEFRSTRVAAEGEGYRIEGELSLHGVTRPITAKLGRRGARWGTRVSIHQPDYGIEPFSAMLGTLKVKPKVEVSLSVAAAAVPADHLQD